MIINKSKILKLLDQTFAYSQCYYHQSQQTLVAQIISRR